VAKKASAKGPRIHRESKGRRGKTVSVIEGLSMDDGQMKTLMKHIKSQLGTGGSLKHGMIEIQGDHREKILHILEKRGIVAKLSGG